MRNLEGLKWIELTNEERNNLYLVANVDRDNVDEEGNCTVDFGEDLAISGKVIYGEEQDLVIEDCAMLYNPMA